MWRSIIGIVLFVVGAVWIGQGAGAIKGSFMTGEPVWAVIGACAVLVGTGLVWTGTRQRRFDRETDD
jgi:hypothetical protein